MVKSKFFLITYILFGVFSLSNCQTVKLAGHYVEDASYGIKHDLNLFENGSFQYIIKEGLGRDTVLGDWNIKGSKQMILSPKKIENYHSEIKCDTCSSRFYIRIYALLDSYELTEPSVKIYSKGVIIKDGIINFIENVIMQKADSIQIDYFGFEPYVFMPQNKNDAIVSIFLIEEQSKLLQKDRILKIKKSKLITEQGAILRKQP